MAMLDFPYGLVAIPGGLLLLTAAIHKTLRFWDFTGALRAYEVPVARVRKLAVVWILAEFVGGVTLLVPSDYRFMPATLLLASTSGAVWHRVRQGGNHECGCGMTASRVKLAACTSQCRAGDYWGGDLGDDRRCSNGHWFGWLGPRSVWPWVHQRGRNVRFVRKRCRCYYRRCIVRTQMSVHVLRMMA